jgi:hypothetical protein
MLSHRQNSRSLRGRRFAGGGEARSPERVKLIKNHPVFVFIVIIMSLLQPIGHYQMYKSRLCRKMELLPATLGLAANK